MKHFQVIGNFLCSHYTLREITMGKNTYFTGRHYYNRAPFCAGSNENFAYNRRNQ